MNIWEERALGFLAKIKPFKKGLRGEIDELIYLGCNFLEIMDESKWKRVENLKIEETPYGVIHHTEWTIRASAFLKPNQDKAIIGMVKRVVELAKVKNFCVEISECTARMKDIFWIESQLEGLQILNFKPNELLINRLEKIRQFKNKIESRKNSSKEQNIASSVINP